MSEPQQPEMDPKKESGVLVVEQTPSHRQRDEGNPAKEPRLPSVKSAKPSDDTNTSKTDIKDKHRKESLKNSKNSEYSLEAISMVPTDIQQKKAMAIPEQLAQITPVQPIETEHIEPATAVQQETPTQKEKPVEKESPEQVTIEAEESSNDEITELRTQHKFSEWSDEEEAGGLSRSDSRASRVTRAVRQLFCCGVPYEAPDEDNISYHRAYAI